MKKYLHLVLVGYLVAFMIVSPTYSATYTVCSSGCDQTTIQAAFDGVDLAPDDIVEVRADTPGGSKSFAEAVTPGTNDSGTLGHPVILRARSGDIITIDGGDVRDNGFVFTNVSYFTLDGFVFSNHTGAAVYGRPGAPRDKWTVQNCTINISLSNGVTALSNQGIGFSGIDKASFYVANVLINNVTIQTGDGSLNEQTDGIAMYFIDGLTISNSTINLRNADGSTPYQHIDGIQLGTVKNPNIFSNTITIYRNHNSGAQGIYIEGNSAAGEGIDLGTWNVYNNVLYADGWGSYGLCLAEKNDTSVQKTYNNTVVNTYALSGDIPILLDGDNIWFKNNVVFTARGNVAASFSSATQTVPQINYNLYYNPSGSLVGIGGAGKSWAQWQALGYDANGKNEDPVFVGAADFHIQTTSPAKNAGVDLSTSFTTDRDGVTRPVGAWDIGAYEYAEPPDTTAPTITAFTIPATATSLNVPISSFTATDAVGVAGYCLVEVNASAGCSWSGSAPSTYSFATAGAKTLYAFAKDAADNISDSATDSVTITLPAAKVTGGRVVGGRVTF